MINQSGIYQIRNLVNGKVYVGSSKCMKSRWQQHRTSLRAGKHRSIHMQRSWTRNGEHTFVFEPLITCAPSMLIWYEQQFMDQLQPEYNNRKLADSNKGNRHTKKTRKVISEAAKKMWTDPSIREAIVSKRLGSKHSDGTLKKLSSTRAKYYENPENRTKSADLARARADLIRLDYNGESKTISEWATTTGISEWAIRQRIVAGWPLDKMLTKKNQKAPIVHNGEAKPLKEWAAEYGMKPETLSGRIKNGWSMDLALTTPVRERSK